jgi:hypothetical protein
VILPLTIIKVQNNESGYEMFYLGPFILSLFSEMSLSDVDLFISSLAIFYFQCAFRKISISIKHRYLKVMRCRETIVLQFVIEWFLVL